MDGFRWMPYTRRILKEAVSDWRFLQYLCGDWGELSMAHAIRQFKLKRVEIMLPQTYLILLKGLLQINFFAMSTLHLFICLMLYNRTLSRKYTSPQQLAYATHLSSSRRISHGKILSLTFFYFREAGIIFFSKFDFSCGS